MNWQPSLALAARVQSKHPLAWQAWTDAFTASCQHFLSVQPAGPLPLNSKALPASATEKMETAKNEQTANKRDRLRMECSCDVDS
ncbi:hypothetical protein [Archangium sp.]|uniref:hypothetical protein n=1 Tax=Archangium sp. TaxID=1872627 RepID=UPI00286D487A|nr:hypothetical protein [Archangium sp.]